MGERPVCPAGCVKKLHKHGSYRRYDIASGNRSWVVLRFLCRECWRTISVLPANLLTYRPLQAKRLQAAFDEKAEAGSGPDPPPQEIEKGCLERAWSRFAKRTEQLRHAFGQLLPAIILSPAQLWKDLRQKMGSLQEMLQWLARTRKISLLGNYACLKLRT